MADYRSGSQAYDEWVAGGGIDRAYGRTPENRARYEKAKADYDFPVFGAKARGEAADAVGKYVERGANWLARPLNQGAVARGKPDSFRDYLGYTGMIARDAAGDSSERESPSIGYDDAVESLRKSGYNAPVDLTPFDSGRSFPGMQQRQSEADSRRRYEASVAAFPGRDFGSGNTEPGLMQRISEVGDRDLTQMGEFERSVRGGLKTAYGIDDGSAERARAAQAKLNAKSDKELMALKPTPVTRSVGQSGEASFTGPGATPFGDTSGQRYLREGNRFVNNPDYKSGGLTVANSDPVSFGALDGSKPGTGAFSVVGQDQFNNLMGFDAYKDNEGNLTSPAIREAELAALRRGESIDRSGPTFSSFGDYGDGSYSPIPISSMRSPMQNEIADIQSAFDSGNMSERQAKMNLAMTLGKYKQENELELNQQEYDSDRRIADQENYFDQQDAQRGTFADRTNLFKAGTLAERQKAQSSDASLRTKVMQGELLHKLNRGIVETAQMDKKGAVGMLRMLQIQQPGVYQQLINGNKFLLDLAAEGGDIDAGVQFEKLGG